MARAAGARAVGAAFATLGRVRGKRRGTLLDASARLSVQQPVHSRNESHRGRHGGGDGHRARALHSHCDHDAVAWALAWMSAGYALGHVTGWMPTPFGFLMTLGLLAGAILAVCLVMSTEAEKRAATALGVQRGDASGLPQVTASRTYCWRLRSSPHPPCTRHRGPRTAVRRSGGWGRLTRAVRIRSPVALHIELMLTRLVPVLEQRPTKPSSTTSEIPRNFDR